VISFSTMNVSQLNSWRVSDDWWKLPLWALPWQLGELGTIACARGREGEERSACLLNKKIIMFTSNIS
jgi:hypothetical protein